MSTSRTGRAGSPTAQGPELVKPNSHASGVAQNASSLAQPVIQAANAAQSPQQQPAQAPAQQPAAQPPAQQPAQPQAQPPAQQPAQPQAQPPAQQPAAQRPSESKHFFGTKVTTTQGNDYTKKIWWPVRALAVVPTALVSVAGIFNESIAKFGSDCRTFVKDGKGVSSVGVTPLTDAPANSIARPTYNPNKGKGTAEEPGIREELAKREADLQNYKVYHQEDERGDFTYSIDHATGRILFKKEIKSPKSTEYFSVRLFDEDGTKPASTKHMLRAARGLIEGMLSNPDFAKALDEHDIVSMTIHDARGEKPYLSVRLLTYKNRGTDENGEPFWYSGETPFGYDAFGRLKKPTAFSSGKEFKFDDKTGRKIIDAMNEKAPKIKKPQPSANQDALAQLAEAMRLSGGSRRSPSPSSSSTDPYYGCSSNGCSSQYSSSSSSSSSSSADAHENKHSPDELD